MMFQVVCILFKGGMKDELNERYDDGNEYRGNA